MWRPQVSYAPLTLAFAVFGFLGVFAFLSMLFLLRSAIERVTVIMRPVVQRRPVTATSDHAAGWRRTSPVP
jgi:hypothetical protein